MTNNDYGVRWQEFNSRDQLVTKEKFFRTDKALQAFVEKLENKDNFYAVVALSNPA